MSNQTSDIVLPEAVNATLTEFMDALGRLTAALIQQEDPGALLLESEVRIRALRSAIARSILEARNG